MKKKLIPLTLGLALVAVTGAALAETPAAPSSPTSILETLQKQKGEFHGFGHKFQWNNEELLTLLKTDEDTLMQALKSGKSLADLAAEKGVPKQQVVDLLTKQASHKLEQAVKDGKLTQDEATQFKSKLNERITQHVEHKGVFHKVHVRKAGHLEDAASVLGMTKEDILTQLKVGKSLAEIAKEKGISEDKLVDSLLQKKREGISKWVHKKWEPKTDNSSKTDIES